MPPLHRFLRPTRHRLTPKLNTPILTSLPTARRLHQSSNTTPTSQEPDLQVGELAGASFRIEPIRRTGEPLTTQRARLERQSRVRGTREADLLLSTFAATHLRDMDGEQLAAYDRFLDENDWDIYYWATQGEEAGTESTESSVAKGEVQDSEAGAVPSPRPGEWAQTVGTFRAAYRPVPKRWRGSEILGMLREHVKTRSLGGTDGGGMAFMPDRR